MASMARKVDPREAAAKKAAEEATKKALADKKAREAADKKAAEMAAALKATQEKEAKEVPPYLNIFVPHLRPVSKPSVSGLVFFLPFSDPDQAFFWVRIRIGQKSGTDPEKSGSVKETS